MAGTKRSDWPRDDSLFISLKDYKTTNHHMAHMMQKELNKVGEYNGLMGLGVHPEPEHIRHAVIRLLGSVAFTDPSLIPADLPGYEPPRPHARRLNPSNPWERRDGGGKVRTESESDLFVGLESLYETVNISGSRYLPSGFRADEDLFWSVKRAAEAAHRSATVVEREARRRWREGEVTRLKFSDNPFSDEREILKGPPADFEKLYQRAWTRIFRTAFIDKSGSGKVGTRVIVEALGLYGSQ